MSVLACDRAGCKNIMCDRYSYDYGYICNDCYSELCVVFPVDIAEFMKTPKKIRIDYLPTLDRIFPFRQT